MGLQPLIAATTILLGALVALALAVALLFVYQRGVRARRVVPRQSRRSLREGDDRSMTHRPVQVTEAANPAAAPLAPYIVAVIVITLAVIAGVVLVLTIRPDKDNAALVAQILGFGTTTLMATLAYMRSTETREVVNSRMDEFKRALQSASDVAQQKARAEGRVEGHAAADARTDVLAEKAQTQEAK